MLKNFVLYMNMYLNIFIKYFEGLLEFNIYLLNIGLNYSL